MAEVKSNEKAAEYAFWNIPGSGSTVTYSLAVFHDIDFVVNEGFRKIPHGGIETGGLLFGSNDANGMRIEAFREVACEHASGPSFSLSENDLVGLSEQIKAAGSDPELQGLKVVGWFLAHTRSGLQLSDRELLLFDKIFPTPGQLTVLVKPERFQATRFGFLVRGADQAVPRDASDTAVILPLPGSKTKAIGPVPSIPAPPVSPSARKLAEAAEEAEEATPVVPEEEAVAPAPAPKPRPAAVTRQAPEPPKAELKNEDVAPPPPMPTRRKTGRLNLEQVRLSEENEAPAVAEQPLIEPEKETPQGETQAPSNALVSTGQKVKHWQDEVLDARTQVDMLNKRRRETSSAKQVLVLPVAALLGCIVGFIGYLQVPSPIIPLNVRSLSQTILVSWPADETRSSVYAAIRVDDGTPILLSPEERAAGQVEVSAASDMKVELIARNWLRDSRGIVRYVKAANLRSPLKIP